MEHFHNPEFNYIEFEAIEREAGLNSFVLTPKRWVEQTRAKGIVTKQGRYAATFAHQLRVLNESDERKILNG